MTSLTPDNFVIIGSMSVLKMLRTWPYSTTSTTFMLFDILNLVYTKEQDRYSAHTSFSAFGKGARLPFSEFVLTRRKDTYRCRFREKQQRLAIRKTAHDIVNTNMRAAMSSVHASCSRSFARLNVSGILAYAARMHHPSRA